MIKQGDGPIFSGLLKSVKNRTVPLLLMLLLYTTLAFAADVKFSVILDKPEYKVEDPIYMTFKLENKGKKPIYVNKRFYITSETLPEKAREITLSLTAPSGAKLVSKYEYETGLPKSDYFVIIEPGKEIVSEDKRSLKNYFEIKDAGDYQLNAFYRNFYGPEIGLDVVKDKLIAAVVSFKILKNEEKK